MPMRTILALSASAMVLALGACSPRFFHRHANWAYRTVTTLDCPQTEGELNRKSASGDGKTCEYTSQDGSAVTLQLIPLTGTTTDSALSPLESSLRAEVPTAASDNSGEGSGEGRVDIDLPGIHIHASGKDGDSEDGHVKIGNGISIGNGNMVVADGGSGHGSVDIEARDKGAEIRVDEGHGVVSRDFILANDSPGPHGFRVAGYEARGPEAGPLVVASMLSKSDDHDRLRRDLRELIRDNLGG